MRRAGWGVVAALLLSACAKAGAERAVSAPPVVAAAPALVRSATGLGDEGDADFRYVPPLPAASAPIVAPRVGAFRLGGGQEVLVVERPEVPVVHLSLRVNWPSSSYRAEWITGDLLLDTRAPGSTLPLAAVLRSLGVESTLETSPEGAFLGCVLAPDALESVLRALFGVLAREAQVDARGFELKRAVRLVALGAPDLRSRMERRIDESLFAPGHPYRENAEKEEAFLRGLKLEDVQRHREGQLRPEAVSVGIVGDVSVPVVQALLGRIAGAGGAAPSRAAHAAPSTPAATRLARGTFLIEEPGRTDVDVVLTWPIQTPAMSSLPVDEVLREVITQVAWVFVERLLPGAYADRFAAVRWRAEQPLFEIGARVQPENAAKFVLAVQTAMEAMEPEILKGDVLRGLRVDVMKLAAVFLWSSEDLARLLTLLGDTGMTLEQVVATHDGAQLLTLPVLRQRLLSQVGLKEVRVVAVGAVGGGRQGLAALGIKPLTTSKRTVEKVAGAVRP
ncbi:hypothetical protein [Chondromyces crocatus]|uniref:Peptidase M16 C-terminal domain-containing protein n=1 Tax=Chondromyces crocatus TaxID=52 RepID=A0A0K1ESI4_CHOCO|nr:hypothetical protein [Chondromyces crocatus]AKT43900.1 uncharacterized protein CMC5_081370 [Chondromyces crocatus]